jgi:hypothetical protein
MQLQNRHETLVQVHLSPFISHSPAPLLLFSKHAQRDGFRDPFLDRSKIFFSSCCRLVWQAALPLESVLFGWKVKWKEGEGFF